jgi:lambda repressor-like predicted transcriptional regulator
MAIPEPAVLRQLYEREGWSVRDIARAFQCRTQVLLQAMDAAAITRRRRGRQRAPLPDWDRAKVQQLVKASGMAYTRAFARKNGVSREKLAVLLGRPGLARGNRGSQRVIEHDDAIRAAYERGVPVKDLAARYRCTVRTINYSLDRTSGKQSDIIAGDKDVPSDCFRAPEGGI